MNTRAVIDRISDTINLITRKRDTGRLYHKVFGNPDGERVLRHIMNEGFVLSSTFVAGDPHQTAMNEGSRRLALSILKMAKIDQSEKFDQIEQQLMEQQL
jgi:hypothetical protein